MTSVAAEPGLSLSWVRFSDDDAECDLRACELEAVARAWYDRTCPHIPDPQLLCADHRDLYEAARAEGKQFVCGDCGQVSRLIRTEPLRG
jgi:hypothetical protein